MSDSDFDFHSSEELHSSVKPDETTTEKHSSLVLILSAIGLALAIALLVGNISISIYQDRQHDIEVRELVERNAAAIRDQDRTIELLCDRGYIIDGIVETAIQLIERPPNSATDQVFVDRLRGYHIQLLDQVSQEDSPCVQD
jgi:hypothetical protein